jgi:hypothetical protein
MVGRSERWFVVAAAAHVTAACGPAVPDPVDCDGDGPTKLLSLVDEHGAPRELHGSIRDERGWLVVVDGDGLALECGELPRRFATGRPGWDTYVDRYADSSVVHSYGEDETHLVFLPGLDEAWLEGIWASDERWVAADGRRLLDGGAGLHLLAPGSSTPSLLYRGRGLACVAGDDAYLWDVGLEGDNSGGGPWQRVVRIPLDGAAPDVVIEGPVFFTLPLTGNRWAIMRSIDDDQRGDILLHDPRNGAETTLATDVDRRSLSNARPQHYWPRCSSWTAVDDPHPELRYDAPDPVDGTPALWRLVP